MKIQLISNINFGIYKGTQKTYYGFVDRGIYRDKVIDIYNAFYHEDGTLKHKLYYVSELVGGWLKSKLKFFKNNKCYYIARGQAKDLNNKEWKV